MPSDAARWAGRVSGTLDTVYRWLEPAQQRRDRQKREEPLGLLAFYAHDSIYNFHVAKRFYTTERKVQIQSTCIFPPWATNNPAEEIMVSSCTPPINPLPPRHPQLLQHPSFQRKESYMWRPPRIWNLGRRQEHWGTDLGEWSRVQGPDPTKWLWAETLSEWGRNVCVTGRYQKEIIHFSARWRKKAGQTPLAAMLLLTPNFSEICLLLQHLNRSAAAAKSLQLCPTLCDPIDGSSPGSPAPGILQARTPEWVAISFTGRRSHQIAFLTWVLAATRSCSASRAATSWISSSMVRPAMVVRAVLICWRMLVIWALRKRDIEGEKFCATFMGNIYETSPILTHKYFSGKHFLN